MLTGKSKYYSSSKSLRFLLTASRHDQSLLLGGGKNKNNSKKKKNNMPLDTMSEQLKSRFIVARLGGSVDWKRRRICTQQVVE